MIQNGDVSEIRKLLQTCIDGTFTFAMEGVSMLSERIGVIGFS